VGVVLAHHGVVHLVLVDRLSRHLGMGVLRLIVEGDGMRLGQGGGVPGRLMGSVGINVGRISPRVHECNVGESGCAIGTEPWMAVA
jgi:hypothetical protein